MRKVSKKRAKQLREYTLLREKYLKENPLDILNGEPATEIHHTMGREGDLLLNTLFWAGLGNKNHVAATGVEREKVAFEIFDQLRDRPCFLEEAAKQGSKLFTKWAIERKI